MPTKPLELPLKVARAFARDMRAVFEAETQLEQDAIASRQTALAVGLSGTARQEAQARGNALPIVLPAPLCYGARNLRGSHDGKRLGNVRLGHLAVDLAQRLSLHRIRRLAPHHHRGRLRAPLQRHLPRGATLQAIHRHRERVFNPDRKDHPWGKRKLKRDQ